MNQTQSPCPPKQILVIGSACVDVIISLHHLPRTQEDLHPTGHTLSLGGCAYNTASAIRLFGAPVTLISPVGSGLYGEFAARELEKKGFPAAIRVPDQENGCCYCLVEAGGERTFLSWHGAEYTFQKSWMDAFDNASFDMVYICGLEIEEPTGYELIEYLERYPKRELFFAPGPRGIFIEKEKMKRLYALHPVLHINESEALALSGESAKKPEPAYGETPIERAARILLSETGNTVIVTLGEQGSFCLEQGGRSYYVPAVPAQTVDAIGAGDSHIGAVMACLSLGRPMRDAIETAGRMAAAVVGVRGSTLTEKEFQTVFQSGPL